MSTIVKTAISLPKELFEEVDTLAKRSQKSRSSVIRTAIETFLNEYKAQKAVIKAKKIYAEIAKSQQKISEDFLSISSETLEKNNG